MLPWLPQCFVFFHNLALSIIFRFRIKLDIISPLNHQNRRGIIDNCSVHFLRSANQVCSSFVMFVVQIKSVVTLWISQAAAGRDGAVRGPKGDNMIIVNNSGKD